MDSPFKERSPFNPFNEFDFLFESVEQAETVVSHIMCGSNIRVPRNPRLHHVTHWCESLFRIRSMYLYSLFFAPLSSCTLPSVGTLTIHLATPFFSCEFFSHFLLHWRYMDSMLCRGKPKINEWKNSQRYTHSRQELSFLLFAFVFLFLLSLRCACKFWAPKASIYIDTTHNLVHSRQIERHFCTRANKQFKLFFLPRHPLRFEVSMWQFSAELMTEYGRKKLKDKKINRRTFELWISDPQMDELRLSKSIKLTQNT